MWQAVFSLLYVQLLVLTFRISKAQIWQIIQSDCNMWAQHLGEVKGNRLNRTLPENLEIATSGLRVAFFYIPQYG